jgi:hypothetical protein
MEPTETYTEPHYLPPPGSVVEPLTATQHARPPRRRVKVMLAGLALAAMLGGGAVSVFAASPDPSASPSNGTTQPGTHGNCPHDQTTDSSTDASSSS